MKVVFLVSGGGGNLKFIFLSSQYNKVKNLELSVIADRSCGALEFAKNNNIMSSQIVYKRDYNVELKDELDKMSPDIVVTNWHKILDGEIVSLYQSKLINLHYSILPAFGGLIGVAPIEKAYRQGCKFVGATCHYVDEDVDSGLILAQSVSKTDIPLEKMIEIVFRQGCILLLNTLFILSNNNISLHDFSLNHQDFSPALLFDLKEFDEYFWERLTTL